MIFLAVLLGFFVLGWAVPRQHLDGPDRWRVALAGAMVVAGLSHLFQPTPFVQHLPGWVPQREGLVLVTGLVEIGLGAGLLLRQPHRRIVGLLLGVFLVAVFPANVYVAVAGIEVDGQPGGIYPWIRLAFQPLFVWLAVWSTRDHRRRAAPVAAPST